MALIDLDIIGLGEYARKIGITPAEHSHFTGKKVTGGHATDSLHYSDQAIDLRDWRPDNAPEYEGGAPVHWVERKKRLEGRFRELGILDELYGPASDPEGHGTHVHLGLKGRRQVPKAYLDYGFTGRWQGEDGSWRTDSPVAVFGRSAGGNSGYQPLSGGGASEPAPRPKVAMDWRADTSSADQNQRSTWAENQGLIQWAQANPGLAERELQRRGLGSADVGAIKQVADDDPRAIGRFNPENRGALGGTLVGGRRP